MGVRRDKETMPLPKDYNKHKLHGVGNIDNSAQEGDYKEIKDFSLNVSFISSHLNTLMFARTLVITFIVIILL